MILIGDRILVQLDKVQDESSDSILIKPLIENGESDGGRPTAHVSNKEYVPKGTILSISHYSREKLESIKASLKVGDKVLISPRAATPEYYFFENRNSYSPQEFKGIVAIPHVFIEAKLTSNEEET